MPVVHLEQLRQGCDSVVEPFPNTDDLPEDLDIGKFRKGQQFFREHITNCVFAMFCSLACGLSVTNLLDPLVFTKKSNTPRKSLQRYLDTIRHVALWHYGDIWDKNSTAYQSVKRVYNMHNEVARRMNNENGTQAYFTQFDMSLVQSGFMGLIVMYPEKFAIHCSPDDLDNYVYFWRWIGFLLGITDQNNICMHGAEDAVRICKEIQNEVVYPSLIKPPNDFKLMASAFTAGASLLILLRVFTTESVVSFTTDLAKKKRIFKLNVMDSCRVLLLRFVVFLLNYSTCFKKFMNRNLEFLFFLQKT